MEQGIILGEQGILAQEQGILPTKSKIIAGRGFRYAQDNKCVFVSLWMPPDFSVRLVPILEVSALQIWCRFRTALVLSGCPEIIDKTGTDAGHEELIDAHPASREFLFVEVGYESSQRRETAFD